MTRGAPMLLVALLAASCVAERAPGVIDVDAAERLHPAPAVPPAPDDPRWEPVSLPDWLGITERRQGLTAWYRAGVRLDAVPTELWAIYLPRIAQHVTVWVNDVLVGESGPRTDPLPRNWNRPQLFAVPPPVLRADENTVLVQLVTHPGAPGFLRGFHVGAMRVLEPLHAQRTWGQVTLAQIVASGAMGGGLLLLLFSLREERFRPVRWLAVGLMLWSWTSADAFVRTIPVPSRWWETSTAAALPWGIVCFAVGFHRLFEIVRPRVERVLLGVVVAHTLALLVLPPWYAFTLVILGGAIAVGIAFYLTAVLLRGAAPGVPPRRALLVPAGAGVLLGLHDLLLVGTGRALTGMLLSPYIPVLAIGATAWMLLERHLASLRETEALNAELEARVAAKHRELEANYERMHALERRHAVAAERERIMQDMHDGMGGQLVSTLAMVEGGGWTSDDVAEALRGALDDLRLVIDSLDPGEPDLLTVLGMVRSRLEPRLARHGLRFQWRVAEIPPIAGFGPETALQLMRVVQEAITNVVKHAGGTTITVRTGSIAGRDGRQGVYVDVEDDGCGIAAAAAPGRGLAGMRRRAARLGGDLTVERTGDGTRVRVWLPVDQAA